MRDLRLLILADSALPIGLHAQSFGLERALQADPSTDLAELMAKLLRAPDVIMDASAVALAYRRSDLVALDTEVTANRIDPAHGRASQRSGRRLAGLAPHIRDTDFCRLVREDMSDGTLGVVHGSITRALGVPAEDSVVAAVHRVATALVFSAVRLGRSSAMDAQRILTDLEPTILFVADEGLEAKLRGTHRDQPPRVRARPSVQRTPRPTLFQT